MQGVFWCLVLGQLVPTLWSVCLHHEKFEKSRSPRCLTSHTLTNTMKPKWQNPTLETKVIISLCRRGGKQSKAHERRLRQGPLTIVDDPEPAKSKTPKPTRGDRPQNRNLEYVHFLVINSSSIAGFLGKDLVRRILWHTSSTSSACCASTFAWKL